MDMPNGKPLSIEAAAENIAASVEKELAKLPANKRDAHLERIHQIASNHHEGFRTKTFTPPSNSNVG